MTAKDVIRNTINSCHQVAMSYIDDLSDADLLVRSVPKANHIAWQLGHLIVSEQKMISELGRRMPPLPAGFAEAYKPETSHSDDPRRFAKKSEYVALIEQMRNATLAALDATPETDFDQPGPESMRNYAPTIGAAYTIIGTHELMHAGQFVPIRRRLGKPALF